MLDLLPNFQKKVLLTVIGLLMVPAAVAQTPTQQQQRGPAIVVPEKAVDAGGVGRTNLQCAGYFRMPALNRLPQIVGGEQEQEKTIYFAGDYVYIDAGQQQGVTEGQEFHIIRPRGEPVNVFRQKKGYMGLYIQELGQLQVVKVYPAVSVAKITFSCETALPGDFLTGVPDRTAPELHTALPLDRFKEPTGRPVGRVMMAKDGREMVTVGDTIFVDLGDEDKLVAGDRLTIYRRVGTGNLNVQTYDLAHRAMEGFESVEYRGGGFSNQAKSARELKGEPGIYRHKPPVPSSQIAHKRPELPWKIVGEAVILNVQVRTATAIISSVTQEVHTGDFVSPR
ncbi:MAG: hypothetical protein ACRD6N_00275 [Pyrinomonadaceae bacterium]